MANHLQQNSGEDVFKPTEKLVDEFTASIGFDHKLAKEDITGSLAHVQMLADSAFWLPKMLRRFGKVYRKSLSRWKRENNLGHLPGRHSYEY